MNEAAKMWVEALRSGEYKQGKRVLHSASNAEGADSELCCLGVACQLYAREKGSISITFHPTSIFSYDGCIGVLPDRVRHWLGLRTEDGSVSLPEGEVTTLALLNDSEDNPWSFKEIADLIESEPELLFGIAYDEEEDDD